MYNQSCQNNCQQKCLVAPTKVYYQHFVTPTPQMVVCPIELRKVNHMVTYPVFVPHYCIKNVNECH